MPKTYAQIGRDLDTWLKQAHEKYGTLNRIDNPTLTCVLKSIPKYREPVIFDDPETPYLGRDWYQSQEEVEQQFEEYGKQFLNWMNTPVKEISETYITIEKGKGFIQKRVENLDRYTIDFLLERLDDQVLTTVQEKEICTQQKKKHESSRQLEELEKRIIERVNNLKIVAKDISPDVEETGKAIKTEFERLNGKNNGYHSYLNSVIAPKIQDRYSEKMITKDALFIIFDTSQSAFSKLCSRPRKPNK